MFAIKPLLSVYIVSGWVIGSPPLLKNLDNHKVLEQSCEELKSTPRLSVRKNLMEFFSVLCLVYIQVGLVLCTGFLYSHDLLEYSTLIT